MKWMLAAVALLAWGPPSQATWMRPLSIEELAAGSSLVAQGVVTRIETRRDAAGRIYTRVEMRVEEVWKGDDPGGTVAWVAGGGTLGEEKVEAVGQARHRVGEQTVVYLTRNGLQEWVLLGLGQGKFQVATDERAGARVAWNPFWGRPARDGASSKPAAHAPWQRTLTFEELRRRTQEAAE